MIFGSRDLEEEAAACAGFPPIGSGFPAFCGPVQQGPVRWQETQIVQSCNTLDDFLPGFVPLVFRFFHMRTIPSSLAAEPACANSSSSASLAGVATRVSARTFV